MYVVLRHTEATFVSQPQRKLCFWVSSLSLLLQRGNVAGFQLGSCLHHHVEFILLAESERGQQHYWQQTADYRSHVSREVHRTLLAEGPTPAVLPASIRPRLLAWARQQDPE